MINNEYLYHFTSSENLIRILETMSLKLSDFKKLNDYAAPISFERELTLGIPCRRIVHKMKVAQVVTQ